MEKQGLIEEFQAQREPLLQACWAHQLWNAPELTTIDSRPLTVLFPGWLNRGPGPDFTEARLVLGEREIFGDVEIHLDESGWRGHGHHLDPAYERVALHVVLRKSGGAAARTPGGQQIPVFSALPFLSPKLLEFMEEGGAMLESYENLPGRCGLRAALAGAEALPRVIAHAAEERARRKAEALLPGRLGQSGEQLLFELVFQSLGYRPHAQVFRDLARCHPVAELADLFDLAPSAARREVLARWFGATGLLDAPPPPPALADARREFEELAERWRGLALPPLRRRLKRGGSRPLNTPERRMVGLFHHLLAFGAGAWLKGWLALLHRLDGLREQKDFRKIALQLLEKAFETPEWEPWSRRYSFGSPPLGQPSRLIGADRIIIIMANAILPFFLAQAREQGDEGLEKLLYRLFIVLPPEAPNQRTRFMEKRLKPLAPLPRSLRTQQGLLQIHQDFCTSFQEGCQSCSFPDLIVSPVRR